MKTITMLTLLILVLLNSCSSIDNSCICTQEFRMYTVLVIDNTNQPVDSLNVEIKNVKTGRLYLFLEKIYLGKGVYQVMNDSYTKEFTQWPEKVLFKGTKNGAVIESEYFFNTDECKCHVYKISGKDTLVINL
ncbi:MAG: hypothetical protein KJ666_02410 [Bacteroidetes bacterium]|nr:hypothetical protein [Bacteroidota bacterium]MBU2585567.1 hypothetical protein [Bacteroidota bacterium]